MKELTTVQRVAVVVSVIGLLAFGTYVALNVGTGLPVWAIAGIVGFVAALLIYPFIRRTPRPPATDREDSK